MAQVSHGRKRSKKSALKDDTSREKNMYTFGNGGGSGSSSSSSSSSSSGGGGGRKNGKVIVTKI